VLEENQDSNDAWLEEWGAGTPKTEVPRGDADGLNSFLRMKKKKPEGKDAVMRKKKEKREREREREKRETQTDRDRQRDRQ